MQTWAVMGMFSLNIALILHSFSVKNSFMHFSLYVCVCVWERNYCNSHGSLSIFVALHFLFYTQFQYNTIMRILRENVHNPNENNVTKNKQLVLETQFTLFRQNIICFSLIWFCGETWFFFIRFAYLFFYHFNYKSSPKWALNFKLLCDCSQDVSIFKGSGPLCWGGILNMQIISCILICGIE